jgi:16S rRNA (cytosine967-C5)-methyltransferase
MKFYRPLLISLFETLNVVLNEQKIAPHVLESTFKKNKKWGSKDRKSFAEAFYEIVKWQMLLSKIIDLKINKQNTKTLAEKNEPRFVDVELIAVYYLSSKGYVLEEFQGFDADLQHKLNQAVDLGRLLPFKTDDLSFLDNFNLKLYEKYSFPLEFHQKLVSEVKDVERFYIESQKEAPLFIRTNLNKNNTLELKKKLKIENYESDQFDVLPHGLKLKQKANLFRTEAFKNGAFEIQDGGSQLIAPFLEVNAGDFVIDACAGGGGKSLHLSNLMENKGRILSMDIHGWKLEELKKRARRNQCHNIEVRVIESTKVIKRLKDKADRLLLDVPCTGSGVFRRNPDAKYKWNENGFKEIEALQKHILSSYSSMVKPEGKMVYSTCSVFASENQNQIQIFLNEHPEWQLEEEKTIFVGENDFDGYYMARLKKN